MLETVRAAACPIETIHMVDDTDQLLPVPDLVMRSEEIDLPAFGLNVSNDELTAILLEHARAAQSFEIVESDIADYELERMARRRSSPTGAG